MARNSYCKEIIYYVYRLWFEILFGILLYMCVDRQQNLFATIKGLSNQKVSNPECEFVLCPMIESIIYVLHA